LKQAEFNQLNVFKQRKLWGFGYKVKFEPKPINEKCFSCKHSYRKHEKLSCKKDKPLMVYRCREFKRYPGAD